MGSFDYVVSLDLSGRRCVVLGDGPMAARRARGLTDAGARVEVYAADPADELTGLDAVVHRRAYEPGDLRGAFLAVATLEDDTDPAAAFEEAERSGVLFSAEDDVEHCHFAMPARVSRADLSLTVSTAGRAPALSKRLRQRLECELGESYGELVEVLHEARSAALPRRVGFGEWSARWESALSDLDGLVELIEDGRREEARDRVLRMIAPEAVEVAG